MLLLIKYTLLYGIVLMLVALGGMFSEHSGVINIALEPVLPVLARHARIMHFPGNDFDGLSVHQKIFLISREDMPGSVIGFRQRHGSSHAKMPCQKQNGEKG